MRTETVIGLSAEGNPISIRQRVDGFEWSVGYRRDAGDRIRSMRYPGSMTWCLIEDLLAPVRESQTDGKFLHFGADRSRWWRWRGSAGYGRNQSDHNHRD
jgi:hypothetical protein